MDTDLEQSLEKLMADPRLVKLCELQRTGDEVLDVISLSENQHSDILAWMFDAREGHGQGDEILRDLLIAASALAADSASKLDGRGATARFFADWPPSRIRTSSFGAAFIARELGMNASERVDLFVIDAQNKFIILIENKAGAKQAPEQLDKYRASFAEAIAREPHLRKYAHVYIAMDRKFDDEAESRPSSASWLHMGYKWLETSADRALMHVDRGNASARLVVSYCNRQTDWENPNNEKCVALAAQLHHLYPEAVKHLLSFSRGRVEREWLAHRNTNENHLLFVLQNKSAVAMLKETQGMASVAEALRSKLPALPRESIDHRRAWLHMCPAGWEQFEGEDWWPVTLSVRYSDPAKTKYVLALFWDADYARTAEEAEELRRRLTSINPKFGTFSESRRRVVRVGDGLSLPELLKLAADFNTRLFAALSLE